MAKQQNMVGSWSFLVGIVLAILVGLGVGVSLTPTVTAVLALLGLIVGLLAVSSKDVEPFIMATVVVLLAAFVGKEVLSVVTLVNLGSVLDAIVALMVPAAVIVALKEAFAIAKKR